MLTKSFLYMDPKTNSLIRVRHKVKPKIHKKEDSEAWLCDWIKDGKWTVFTLITNNELENFLYLGILEESTRPCQGCGKSITNQRKWCKDCRKKPESFVSKIKNMFGRVK